MSRSRQIDDRWTIPRRLGRRIPAVRVDVYVSRSVDGYRDGDDMHV